MSTSLGTCPACHEGEILESDRAYGCSHWKRVDGDCHFTIWKTVAGHTITAAEAKALLDGQSIGPFDDLRSKAGKAFSASFQIDDDTTGHLEFLFAPRDKVSTASASTVSDTFDAPF